MCGNVEEWCLDWYGPYIDKEQTDPGGYSDGIARVTRGGSPVSYTHLDVYKRQHGYSVIALGELRMEYSLEGNHKTNPQQLIYALDWMEQQLNDSESEYYNRCV